MGPQAPESRADAQDRDAFVVAISSRALFDLGESHELFERDGIDAFATKKKAEKKGRRNYPFASRLFLTDSSIASDTFRWRSPWRRFRDT